MAWQNTGNARWRQTRWLRKMVIQVEQRDDFHAHWYRWKDATFDDLQDAVFKKEENRAIDVPALRLVR